MPPKQIKGISVSSRAVSAPTHLVPDPPEKCEGYMYTVQPRDNLHSIAKKFNCSVSQLLQGNPQIGKRAGTIYSRQIICIPGFVDILPPGKIHAVGPQILFVEMLDAMGNQLPVSNGFVILAPRTFFRIIFSEPVSQAFIFFVPSRQKIFRPQYLVAQKTLVPPQRQVRFIWDVPGRIRGSLFIVGCNTRICGPPEEILVRRP